MPTVLWRSEALADVPVLLRPCARDEPCDMFHIAIADVHVDGVGAEWLHDDVAPPGPDAPAAEHIDMTLTSTVHTRTEHTDVINAAELACGHVFHACALALHFCTNDMRCPVCRRGLPERALIESFAPRMQDALLAKTAAMHLGAAQDDDPELTVDLSVAAIARDLVFEAHMHYETPAGVDVSVRFRTPVHPARDAAHASPDPNVDEYCTHRSFQRKFNKHVKKTQDTSNLICLSIAHPLMPTVMHSAMFDARALTLFADTGMRVALSSGIGFVLPVHSDAGIRLELYLNTDYMKMACVQNMMQWQYNLLH